MSNWNAKRECQTGISSGKLRNVKWEYQMGFYQNIYYSELNKKIKKLIFFMIYYSIYPPIILSFK